MKKKIILVEGIPGSGKSTNARFISVQLERNGFSPTLYLETTADHPIIFLDSIDDENEWIQRYTDNWSAFLNHPGPAPIVMESALFQFPIIYLLNKDIDRKLIQSIIADLCAKLSEHDVSLIFLYQDDATSAIKRMIASRGGDEFLTRKYNEYKEANYYRNRGQTGAELHLKFLGEYAELVRSLSTTIPIRTFAIENSKCDWDTYERQILQQYQISLHPDPILQKEELLRYAGTFRNMEMNFETHIEWKEEALYIFGNRKLRCRKEHVFYLDDMSVEVTFLEQDGSFSRIRIGEKDIFANRKDEGTIFERIS